MRRVRITFAVLVGVAVVAASVAVRAWSWEPGPATALALAGGALVAVVAAGLMARIFVVLEQSRRVASER